MKFNAFAGAGAMVVALLVANGAGATTVFSQTSTEGVTFTLTEVSDTVLTLDMTGIVGGDWDNSHDPAKALADFSLNNIGSPASVTATLQPSGPAATSTGGDGLSNGNGGGGPGCTGNGNEFCFAFSPKIPVTAGGSIDLVFKLLASGGTFDLTDDNQNLPHLKAFFVDARGSKVGSLYSEDLALSTRGPVPEPAAWAMMLVGFGAIGGAMRMRRKTALAAA